MPLRRSQIIIIGIGLAIIVAFLLLYFNIIPGLRTAEKAKPVKLAFWGIEEEDVFRRVFADYRKEHPNITVQYKKFREDLYEDGLIDALAAGNVPDIIMFRNTWLPKHFDKLQPLESPTAYNDIQKILPTVVLQDFAPDKLVYALPLYVDTLAMMYNGDIFDRKGVAVPPRNWLEFQDVVTKLRTPIAIGGSNRSISHASDLLQLLFLQAGVPMVDENFTEADLTPSGVNALSFYTQFANPKSPYYTWSDNFQYSLDSFAQEKTAIIFTYHDQLKNLHERNPSLSLKISPLPQPSAAGREVNWARYYGLAVPLKSANASAAWQLIAFLTTNEAVSAKYLEDAKHPPALRSLINKKLADPDIGVFAKQALSARSYPHIDDRKIEETFSLMIESVLTGRQAPFSAVLEAEGELSKLIRLRRKQ